jgi:radical SAM protein with 4Fe4S-binding SPASM domain
MNNTEEPLLGKGKAIDRIKAAKDHGFIDIMMNTNGVLLNEKISNDIIDSGLTRLLIGFDGNSKETYEKVRVGANYDQVKANIEKFLSIRKKRNSKLPLVRLSFVVTEVNKHEVVDFYEYWKDKVDYVAFQDYIVPPVENPDLLTLENNIKNESFDCDEPWNRLTIRANGDVLPCCSFWGYYLPINNVFKDSIYNIWNGGEINNLRDSFVTQQLNDTCKKCLNGC